MPAAWDAGWTDGARRAAYLLPFWPACDRRMRRSRLIPTPFQDGAVVEFSDFVSSPEFGNSEARRANSAGVVERHELTAVQTLVAETPVERFYVPVFSRLSGPNEIGLHPRCQAQSSRAFDVNSVP